MPFLPYLKKGSDQVRWRLPDQQIYVTDLMRSVYGPNIIINQGNLKYTLFTVPVRLWQDTDKADFVSNEDLLFAATVCFDFRFCFTLS